MSFAKKTVQSLDCAGKRVLMRVDFNVPTKNGEVADASRIEAAMPTIRYLLQKGARLVLCSHLGRPKGGPEAKYSMQPVRAKLERLLRQNVAWADDCVGSAAQAASRALKDGEVLLVENLRFHAEEEANDRDFSHELARHKQTYINDAFGAAHRPHASIVGVTRFIAERAAGFLMMRELDELRAVTENPERPSVADREESREQDADRRPLESGDDPAVAEAGAVQEVVEGEDVGADRAGEIVIVDLARTVIVVAARRLLWHATSMADRQKSTSTEFWI